MYKKSAKDSHGKITDKKITKNDVNGGNRLQTSINRNLSTRLFGQLDEQVKP